MANCARASLGPQEVLLLFCAHAARSLPNLIISLCFLLFHPPHPALMFPVKPLPYLVIPAGPSGLLCCPGDLNEWVQIPHTAVKCLFHAIQKS